jgi:hypothetical protein
MLRIVDVPKDLTLKLMDDQGNDVEQVMTFKKFAVYHLDAYSVEQKLSLSQLKQLQAIVDVVEAGNGTMTFKRDDDWEVYKTALGTPRYRGRAGRQLIPFYDAAVKCQEVPEKKDDRG